MAMVKAIMIVEIIVIKINRRKCSDRHEKRAIKDWFLSNVRSAKGIATKLIVTITMAMTIAMAIIMTIVIPMATTIAMAMVMVIVMAILMAMTTIMAIAIPMAMVIAMAITIVRVLAVAMATATASTYYALNFRLFDLLLCAQAFFYGDHIEKRMDA